MIKYITAAIAALVILTAGYSYSQAAPSVGDEPKVCAQGQAWGGA